MASYAEMAVRTGTSQAQVQGRVEKFAANGKDLGRFSYAPESCEECDRWEGKIVSLKGLTPGYPTLASVTENSHMLGPNCTHTLNLYTPGLTRDAQPEKGNGEGYQERQRQRYLERGIRDWKRREAVALSDEERAKCAAKVKEWQSSMRDFIEDTGRRRKREREQITGRAR
jgi:hypothetical protein